MGNILETYNHSMQQALANVNSASALLMESHKNAQQNINNTIKGINETLRESEKDAFEREKTDIAHNQAIDNSFHQNSFMRTLAYKDSGMSDKQVQEQIDKDLQDHRAKSGYKENTSHKGLVGYAIDGVATLGQKGMQGIKKLREKGFSLSDATPQETSQAKNTFTPTQKGSYFDTSGVVNGSSISDFTSAQIQNKPQKMSLGAPISLTQLKG